MVTQVKILFLNTSDLIGQVLLFLFFPLTSPLFSLHSFFLTLALSLSSLSPTSLSFSLPVAFLEMPQEKVKFLIVDSGALFSGLQCDQVAEKWLSVPEVVQEVRDRQTRQDAWRWLDPMQIRTPSNMSMQAGKFDYATDMIAIIIIISLFAFISILVIMSILAMISILAIVSLFAIISILVFLSILPIISLFVIISLFAIMSILAIIFIVLYNFFVF
jgi:hypothetical protein